MPTTPVAETWSPIFPCDEDTIDAETLKAATAAAQSILFAVSGRRFGVYDTTEEAFVVTSCQSLPTWQPYQLHGLWYNARCGGGCTQLTLRSQPVRTVAAVRSGDVTLDADDWFLTGNTVNIPNGCPACSGCESPRFQVDYQWGIKPDELGNMALGEVACEVIEGWEGRQCRLSARAQSVSRQGVTVDLLDAQELLDGGLIGTPLADSWIRTVNPNKLQRPSRVFSPDVPMQRDR